MADSADPLVDLNLQLSEVEMLRSMYPNEEELHIDEEAFVDVQDYVANRTRSTPSHLNFTLKVRVDVDGLNKYSSLPSRCEETESLNQVEIFCALPHDYPTEKAEVFVRSEQLNRTAQKEINSALRFHLSTMESGHLCILPTVHWIQENAASYLTERKANKRTEFQRDEKDLCENQGNLKETRFCRLWLYMHHIYSKSKRRNIVAWASDYKLTGFCLPGKPGVVCVEGDKKDVDEYYAHLRRLSWKRITCRHQDMVDNVATVDEQRKFGGFTELNLDVHGTRDSHLDLGQFFQYLTNHGLGEMFQILFGVDGKSSDN